MKKIYLIIFFLILAIGIQAQSGTYTANGVTWTYRLKGSEAIITGETQGSKTFTGPLNIPDHVIHNSVSFPVTEIERDAFRAGEKSGVWMPAYINATSLTLPATLKKVGSNAFDDCTGLSGSLIIPNSVTTIERYAFYNCSGLTGALVIPNGVTTIAQGAFHSCSGFTSLSLPNSITKIETGTFGDCRSLTGPLVIPNSVTTIGAQAFSYCRFTGPLVIPNSVTSIGESAFWYSPNYTSLTLPENLTTLGNAAFSDCTGLTGTLVIPNSLTSIGYRTFKSCRFTSLSIPNSITTIGGSAFESCEDLTGTLTIPNGVTTIGESAFQQCRGISKLNIPKSVTTIAKRAFSMCLNLEDVNFENGSLATNLGVEIFENCRRLKFLDVTNLPSITQQISRSNYVSPFSGLNPYTVIYLPDGSNTPNAGQENFVLNGTCDNFVVYDKSMYYEEGKVGCDYPIQYQFVATKAIYRDRYNFLYQKLCNTICLPYPATLPNNIRAYELKEKSSIGRNSFMFVSIGDGGTQLEANKPYLVRVIDPNIGNIGGRQFETSHNVQVPVTPPTIEVPATADGTIFFGGTTVNIDNATAAAGGYYNLENNTWKPIKTDNPNGYVHSFRAYIRSTSPTPAKGFAIVLDDENETTGIDNAEEDIEKGDGKIYSLDGKLLGTDVDALKSGEIYIKNGKKFYKF